MITPDDFIPVSPASAAPLQGASFSADGRRIAYLHRLDGPDTLALSVYDRDTDTSTLRLHAGQLPPVPMSLAEELARERARQRYDGITHGRWLPGRSDTLWSIVSNRLVVCEPGAEPEVYAHPTYIDAASVVTDGEGHRFTFTAGGDLWRVGLAPLESPPRFHHLERLTADASESLLNGIPDGMTREETYNGAAFVVAGPRLAWARFDSSEVELITVGNGAQTRPEPTRYARPGRPVAVFSVELRDVDGRQRTLLPATPQWPYFRGLVDWGGQRLLLTRLSRDQTQLQLLLLDPAGHAGPEPLLTLTQRPWINPVAPPLRRGDGSFFLGHENAGIGRIGLYGADGSWQRDLADDVGHVDTLLGLDADQQGVIFGATGADPREHHLFRARPSDGWRSRALTRAAGTHAATLAPDAAHWLRTHEALDVPTHQVLESLDGFVERPFEPEDRPAWTLGVAPPRPHALRLADGTTLYAAVYAPDASHAGPRPVVLLVYGGPHLQAVRDAWALTTDIRAQHLAQRGFVVVKLDNRGAAGRGQVFETPLYGRLGHQEVDDQCEALALLLPQLPRADASRVAACGWSYGGYMTLRCLQRRPDLFKAGVAGAPVVNWEDYDAPYTERYMGTPTPLPGLFDAANADGYRDASVTRGEGRVAAPLLLIHGLNDENVLFRHSAALIEDLAERGVPYELLLLPGERHGVRAPAQRRYLEQRIAGFLERVLA